VRFEPVVAVELSEVPPLDGVLAALVAVAVEQRRLSLAEVVVPDRATEGI